MPAFSLDKSMMRTTTGSRKNSTRIRLPVCGPNFCTLVTSRLGFTCGPGKLVPGLALLLIILLCLGFQFPTAAMDRSWAPCKEDSGLWAGTEGHQAESKKMRILECLILCHRTGGLKTNWFLLSMLEERHLCTRMNTCFVQLDFPTPPLRTNCWNYNKKEAV